MSIGVGASPSPRPCSVCRSGRRTPLSSPRRRSSDLVQCVTYAAADPALPYATRQRLYEAAAVRGEAAIARDRKSTRLNSSHVQISYAAFCLKTHSHIRHLAAVALPKRRSEEPTSELQ